MAESDTEIPNNESSKIETALNASTECNDSIIRPSALEDFAGQGKNSYSPFDNGVARSIS